MLTLCVVDDDEPAAERYSLLAGLAARVFGTASEFLAFVDGDVTAVVLLNVSLSGGDGFRVLREMTRRGLDLPVVATSPSMTVSLAARSVREGAVTAVERHASDSEVRAALAEALRTVESRRSERPARRNAARRFAALDDRERQVLTMALQGLPNKLIAKQLGTSERTVERHRGSAFEKLGVETLVQAASLHNLLGGWPPGR